MITTDKLLTAAAIGQPGCLIRLAEWLDIDIVPTDEEALQALIDYYNVGYWIDGRFPLR